MTAYNPLQLRVSRRQFFGHNGLRLGSLALAAMAGRRSNASGNELTPAGSVTECVHPPLPGLPHFRPKAKSIIYLHYNGGPPQHDTWDYKPQLEEYFDKDLPESIRNGQRLSTMTVVNHAFPSHRASSSFSKWGNWACGLTPS